MARDDSDEQQRNRIAHVLLMRALEQRGPIDTPTLNEIQRLAAMRASDPGYAAMVARANYQGHSPTNTFEMSPSDMPTGSLPDNPGSTYGATFQGGALPTGRDVFDPTPAQDWGGVFSPAPTMSSPLPSYGTPTVYDDSPVATPPDDPDTFNMPEFNPDEGLPNAPGEQDASLGGALGAMAGMGFGDVGVGDVGMGGGGLGAVGGTEGVGGAGDTSGGSVG